MQFSCLCSRIRGMEPKELAQAIQSASRITFSRSGGNDGQNVNKVNTKVHLVLYLDQVQGFSEEERERIRKKLSTMINKDGALFLDVEDTRKQETNRLLAIQRMEERILEALKRKRKRHKTRPTHASIERRLHAKRATSERKKNRTQVWI